MVVIETQRLLIRKAVEADAPLYLALWTDPRVMRNVGFPQGLPISLEEVRAGIAARQAGEVWQWFLVVVLKQTGAVIGECKMHLPDEAGIASTDVKLLPEYWGNRYGVEVKRALVEYLFEHTDCTAVEATPNVDNVASIKMQEAVGGQRVGEQVFEFPAEMQNFTTSVRAYVNHVYRHTFKQVTVTSESDSHLD
jgi:RimJ/RimL family protein N-acetyltransferase